MATEEVRAVGSETCGKVSDVPGKVERGEAVRPEGAVSGAVGRAKRVVEPEAPARAAVWARALYAPVPGERTAMLKANPAAVQRFILTSVS